MEFVDLKKQYRELKDEMDAAVLGAMGAADFILGRDVKELEGQLAEYAGRKHCVSCANGTDALILALMAYGVGKGDGVFVPTFTFYASAEAVASTGATPIFVDVDSRTFNLCPESLAKAAERVKREGRLRPGAVMAVDLFGQPADYQAIDAIAAEYNLLVVEDGAQGFGGSVKGKRACSFGDISTTSFFPAKPLGCYGDGGAVFTDEDKVKDTLESLRAHGKGRDKYDNVRLGLNSRLDTVQAAVLKVKLRAFREFELKRRQEIAAGYGERLAGAVETPHLLSGFSSGYAQYSILAENEAQRDRIQEALKELGIPSMIYYKKPMHRQTVFRNNLSAYWGFPQAEKLSETILSLPMHAYLSDSEMEAVCQGVWKGVKG